MNELIVTENGFTLTPIEGEMRIHDLELGRKLGFADPRMVRKLIKSNSEKLNSFSVLYAVEQTEASIKDQEAAA